MLYRRAYEYKAQKSGRQAFFAARRRVRGFPDKPLIFTLRLNLQGHQALVLGYSTTSSHMALPQRRTRWTRNLPPTTAG